MLQNLASICRQPRPHRVQPGSTHVNSPPPPPTPPRNHTSPHRPLPRTPRHPIPPKLGHLPHSEPLARPPPKNLYIEYRRGPKHKKPLITSKPTSTTPDSSHQTPRQNPHRIPRQRPASHFKNAPVNSSSAKPGSPPKSSPPNPRKNSRTLDIQLHTNHKIPKKLPRHGDTSPTPTSVK